MWKLFKTLEHRRVMGFEQGFHDHLNVEETITNMLLVFDFQVVDNKN